MRFREWWLRNRQRLAGRALIRQRDYQRHMAEDFSKHGAVMPPPSRSKAEAANELLSHVVLREEDRLLEVGPGARGLLFHLQPVGVRIGVDPLAVEYRVFFPAWSGRLQTCAAFGEDLPFRDERFDVVICDNVIDHAEDPAKILREVVRVLRPNGTLYFTVNVHHPFYRLASLAHAFWNALGLRIEVGPFADHTVHLTIDDVRRMRTTLPLRVLLERDEIAATRQQVQTAIPRRPGDLLKRLFYKNARYVLIAAKAGALKAEEPAA